MPSPTLLSKLNLSTDVLQGRCHKLKRSFFNRPAAEVAPDILGCLLIHRMPDGRRHIGRIVEVEAYLGPRDLAAHTSKGRTPRTEAMFGPPGHAYVYLIYGMYHCINAVTGPRGSGTAVLLRALAPVRDIDVATNGPGRLCKAMDITLDHYGQDLCGGGTDLWIARDESPEPPAIVASPRIGVDYAGEEWASKPLRFYVDGHPAVSRRPSKKKTAAAADTDCVISMP